MRRPACAQPPGPAQRPLGWAREKAGTQRLHPQPPVWAAEASAEPQVQLSLAFPLEHRVGGGGEGEGESAAFPSQRLWLEQRGAG